VQRLDYLPLNERRRVNEWKRRESDFPQGCKPAEAVERLLPFVMRSSSASKARCHHLTKEPALE